LKQDPLKTGASSLGLLGFLLLAGLGCSSPEEPPELAMVMGEGYSASQRSWATLSKPTTGLSPTSIYMK